MKIPRHPTLRLAQLAQRHPALTVALGNAYEEAAIVCLDRHHASPTELDILFRRKQFRRCLEWRKPDPPVLRAYANTTDTTEWGAYALALIAVEECAGLVAVRRAETLTGADYYLGAPGSNPQDLEQCLRLEVSGVDSGEKHDVAVR